MISEKSLLRLARNRRSFCGILGAYNEVYILLLMPFISMPELIYGKVFAQKWFLIGFSIYFGTKRAIDWLTAEASQCVVTIFDVYAFAGVLGLMLSVHNSGDLALPLCSIFIAWGISKLSIKFNFLGGFVLFGSLYAVVGLVDFYKFGQRSTGPFDNSGIYSSCLATLFPILLGWIYRQKLNGVSRLASYTLIAVYGLLILMTQARAGILAVFTGSAYVVLNNLTVKGRDSRFKIKLKHVVLMLLCISVIVIATQSQSKFGSTNGRILIYRIAYPMIFDSPLTGHGYHSFKKDYLFRQASFFRYNPDSKFADLADNTGVAFNEYLQIAIEQGVWGILLVCSLIYFLLYYKVDPKSSEVVYILRGALISFCTISMFSYPLRDLHSIAILIILVGCLASFHKGELFCIHFSKRCRWLILIFVLVVNALITRTYIREFKAVRLWTSVIDKVPLDGKIPLESYERLYEDLQNNELFLYHYGAMLSNSGEAEKSMGILRKYSEHSNEVDLWLYIGDNYKNLKQFSEAESCYIEASMMVPNRFLPLYKLILLYDKQRNVEKIRATAHNILTKKIKVPSVTIDEIRLKVKEILLKYEKDA